MQLDDFDKKILELMQKNSRIPTETIAEQIGLSTSAVQRRLKKMREEKVILNEIVVVAPQYLTHTMTFIAGMEIERDNYEVLARFKAWAKAKDNIQQIYYVTGQVDLMIVVTAADAVAYDAFIELLMQENPQIQRVKTHVVLDKPKQSFYVPLKEAQQ
ncbi:Leucine-responsive regulatory protein [Vibrio aerogenes CECT 7868]|uniref:Leucine-responsive regulatory protein n=1 Tax=Vibrio aerogenes CECT 7868 TaxID=1216006 RepID=A0A1M5XSF3_9VIBR|nr:Lrp/AsnC family transcriptional regulator [Vibrio aerogenes]SHI02730.1 Leucine-responsive regulatory protein [Vibrio aerogenes CECT 7868]